MKIVLFYHSLISDWNHGNAHFLRGVASELAARDCEVDIYEPLDSWSLENLVGDHGIRPIREFHRMYPGLRSHRYEIEKLDLDEALENADLVICHEWNSPDLVRRLGKKRAAGRHFRLLFHDTHHRAVTAPREMAAYDLRHYDGVLAYGKILSELYLERGWAARAWTWHEAADTSVFFPHPEITRNCDVTWVGNWGDGERAAELAEFLINPVSELGLSARVHGVRYPADALDALSKAGIAYCGWLANFEVPKAFARARLTVHIPRRPYVRQLRGIPTIRPFEAMACGIPLICAPWDDIEGLFTPGKDFLMARDGAEMARQMRALLEDRDMARAVATSGYRTVLSRHTCAHRVDELFEILREIHPEHRRSMLAAESGPFS